MEQFSNTWASIVQAAENHPGFAAYVQAFGSVAAILIAEARVRHELARRDRATLRFATRELVRLDAIEASASEATRTSGPELDVRFGELEAQLIALSSLFGNVDVSRLPPGKHAAYLILTRWATTWSAEAEAASSPSRPVQERHAAMTIVAKNISSAIPALRKRIDVFSNRKRRTNKV